MHEHVTAQLVAIGVVGLGAQWLAWRLRLPAILLLLLAGIALGPLGGWLQPDLLFGDLLFPVVSLAVAVILFEGGLTLHLDELRGLAAPVRRLLTEGVAITWAGTTLAAHYLVGLDWDLALLFGAVTVVTGPTVIGPLLRTVRPSERVAGVLRWEGIVIDPLGALLAVLVFEFIVAGQGEASVAASLGTFALTLVAGSLAGAAAGYALGVVLRRFWLPAFLHSVGTLSLVFAVFFLANQIQAESGLLAVTVMGMWLANMRGVPLDDILSFKESLSVMLISVLFVVLAARLQPADLLALGAAGLALVAVMQFLIRPASAVFCTLGSELSWRERALVAWIAPRGIVAAAISALFALSLEQSGHPEAAVLVPLTFLVIIATVVLQSATARPLARLLGVTRPPPRGVLMVGAGPVSRALGEVLQRLDFPVMLADAHWDEVQDARMAGLPAYFGNPTSEHAERQLDLNGIGMLLALSPRSDLNSLACLHFAGEFGEHKVFRLSPGEKDPKLPSEMRQRHRRDNTLFAPEVTYAMLASRLAQGDEVHATELTEQFGWEDYLEQHGSSAIPLLAVDRRGHLRVFGGDRDLTPEPGWTVIGLVPGEEKV